MTKYDLAYLLAEHYHEPISRFLRKREKQLWAIRYSMLYRNGEVMIKWHR